MGNPKGKSPAVLLPTPLREPRFPLASLYSYYSSRYPNWTPHLVEEMETKKNFPPGLDPD
ncbi:UNVERIFIED_CONTAM: hypothetical protein Sradi_2987100 [Sesamum radiatum]|uniref:Uncharacterized protein n=1 Tax=Sesamum radiatum TaxID=300843 RepID=A0AAW2S0P3_SESRA